MRGCRSYRSPRRGGSVLLAGPPGPVNEPRVAVAGGTIPVRILTPPGRPGAVIVYFHGGGWVLGDLDESGPVARAIASHCGATVVNVGYRLAPEYRYPTATEDAWSAVTWVAEHQEEIAGERLPLIVAGEGAGGNLAAVVARRSAERPAGPAANPAVDLQILICPVTDCDFDSLSYTDPANQLQLDRDYTGPANQLQLDRDAMIWFWDHYAPDVPGPVASGRLAPPDGLPVRTPARRHPDRRARRTPRRRRVVRDAPGPGRRRGRSPPLRRPAARLLQPTRRPARPPRRTRLRGQRDRPPLHAKRAVTGLVRQGCHRGSGTGACDLDTQCPVDEADEAGLEVLVGRSLLW